MRLPLRSLLVFMLARLMESSQRASRVASPSRVAYKQIAQMAASHIEDTFKVCLQVACLFFNRAFQL
jgi:hypothetical protein